MFEGFTDRTFEFYMAIRFNNNREFFTSNRAWYEQSVARPMTQLIEALTPTALMIDPLLDTRVSKCLARIHRDMRHAHGGPPYRDYSFMKFRRPGEERYTMLGLYFDLGVDGASYGMGIYEKNMPLMNALRRAILLEAELIIPLVRQAERVFTLHPDTIKRMPVPDGVPEPLRHWYPMRGFYIEKEITDFALIKSPALVDEIVGGLSALKGLYQYIQNLTPIEEIV